MVGASLMGYEFSRPRACSQVKIDKPHPFFVLFFDGAYGARLADAPVPARLWMLGGS